MKKFELKSVLLTFIILLLFSCQEGYESQSGKIVSDPTLIFDSYILPEYKDGLLQNKKRMNQYNIGLAIDRIEKKVRATEELVYFNSSYTDLRSIHFRLLTNNESGNPMKIDSVSIDGKTVPFSYANDYTTLIIPLGQSLVNGEIIEIDIEYTIDFKIPPNFYFGFARIDKEGFSLPHFYPTVARIVDGEWENDDLVAGGDLLSADSSWFTVQIETDDDLVLVTSGNEISSEITPGMQKRTFAAGPVRDFFICGDNSFVPQTQEAGDTKVISYSRKKDKRRSMKAARITSSALSLFNEKFGNYPYSEIKIVALPMTALGIEFPGIFAVNASLYKKDGTLANVPTEYYFEPTVVHEAAHQWFYSLLGNNQLKEPWIDEALTQYSVWLYYNELVGETASVSFFGSLTSRWDSIHKDEIPIDLPVSSYLDNEYSPIIYGRAPLFILDLKNEMGEGEFHNFIKHLISKYSHKLIDTITFRNELMIFSDSPVDTLFDQYFSNIYGE